MIYLLEDDSSIRELVIYTLKSQGIEAEGFSVPSKFWDAMKKRVPELVLLDIMLPEEDGLQVLKHMRSASAFKKVPVIMLTAKGSEYDKVLGLNSGADDYIPKPFGMMELLARINAVLRRSGNAEEVREYLIGDDLYMCPSAHSVKVNGKQVDLTLKEFELLRILIENKGTVFTRSHLLDKIWGYEFDGESRTVDVHVRTLRQKLGSAGKYIHTVRGIGYKIEEEDE